jgi:hypothetical protein
MRIPRTIAAAAAFIAFALYLIPGVDDRPGRSLALVLLALFLVLATAVLSQRRADRRRKRDRQAHAEQVAGWDVEPYVIGTDCEPGAAGRYEWRRVESTWPEIAATAAERSTEHGVGHAFVQRHHADGSITTWTWRSGALVGEERRNEQDAS